MQRKTSSDGKWIYHDVPYLMQHARSGMFYVRKRWGRVIVQRSLDTTLVSEAKERLPGKLVELKAELDAAAMSADLPRLPKGYAAKDEVMAMLPKSVNLDPTRATRFSEGAAVFLDMVNSDATLSDRTKFHRSSIVRTLLTAWKDLPTRRLADLPEEAVRQFFLGLAKSYSASQYNAIRWVFRSIVNLMLERDARLGLPLLPDPTARIRRLGTRVRDVQLPSHAEFQAVLHHLDAEAPKAAFLARLAAYTGVRWIEGKALRWGDVDLRQKQVRVWCAKRRRRSSAGQVYRIVPLIPDAVAFFKFWAEVLRPLPQDHVMPHRRIDAALHAACDAVKVPRLRFHDLRHYFATRCIEAGVDIPTVSRWLGHLDGGALALKVYGHLRNEHSQNQAARVALQEDHERYQRLFTQLPPILPAGAAEAPVGP